MLDKEVVFLNHGSFGACPRPVFETYQAIQLELERQPVAFLGRELNDRLSAATGWSVVAVPGLVPDAVFFEHLANRRFPAGNFIRTPDQIDYLQEPDVFHDVFGHVPMLMNPVMADFIQAYGLGGLRAQQLGDKSTALNQKIESLTPTLQRIENKP